MRSTDLDVYASVSPDSGSAQAPGTMPYLPRLRLLSYNIQSGIASSRYRHYLTRSWQHVLPDSRRLSNLNRIANLVRHFDLVGLQETDSGSFRSGFVNQTEYLALKAHFPSWYDQTNRNLGMFAQHSIGFLSRFQPTEIVEHKLPGMIPGRGTLGIKFGDNNDALVLFIVHFALGKRARLQQILYVGEIVRSCRHAILMGDLNFQSDCEEMELLLATSGLREPISGLHTFPSWRPQRNIDHILVSPSLRISNVSTLNYPYSDHLPISMEIVLPQELAQLSAAA